MYGDLLKAKRMGQTAPITTSFVLANLRGGGSGGRSAGHDAAGNTNSQVPGGTGGECLSSGRGELDEVAEKTGQKAGRRAHEEKELGRDISGWPQREGARALRGRVPWKAPGGP